VLKNMNNSTVWNLFNLGKKTEWFVLIQSTVLPYVFYLNILRTLTRVSFYNSYQDKYGTVRIMLMYRNFSYTLTKSQCLIYWWHQNDV
jgi:hypothetical protein